ncbi:hypothetical protein DL96DRAFT_1613501 [Flagelloscypha sp. PMI_526]|nr:hypothetical protein DL96DRAFT_1613501 [Flagelloscypha sp. PMI_526]
MRPPPASTKSDMQRSSPGPFLPFEMIDRIVMFAADSGGQSVALQLSLVSHLLHKTAIGRLYHTLRIDNEAMLESIFCQAISSRTWIASAVRVLIVGGLHASHYDDLLIRILSLMTGLISVRLAWSAGINSVCLLPRVRRVGLAGPSPLPLHLSHNITHFHVSSLATFSQVLQMKEEFVRLTHFLLMFVDIPGLPQFFRDLRNGLPRSLMFLAVYLGEVQFDRMTDVHHLALLHGLIDDDNRIVFWSMQAVPSNWELPRLLLFQEKNLIPHFMEALNDDEVGFWELVEHHVQERVINTQL